MRCGAVGLPNGWRWGILGEECEVVGGGTPKRDVVTYFGGTVPWATPTDVTALDSLEMSATKETVTAEGLANSSAKLLPKGAVLLTSRATIGFTAVAATQMCTNQGFANFVCKEALLPEYLAYWLPTQKDEMMRLAGGTTFKEISRGALKKFRIPVAPLTEQRRIVDILKRADGIRRLRKQAIQTARELVPALFVDMFGDPATNPKGWERVPFSTVGTLDRGKSKHRPRNDPVLFGGPYPFIQTGEVANSGGRIRSFGTTYSKQGLAQSRLWPKGTLCITIAANIAETGVLEFDACFPDSVVGFLPGPQVTTEFVQAWLAFLQPTIEANAPQLAQKNINLRILGELPIPIPPMDLQHEFSRRRESVELLPST